jgi:hypothetical protein
MRKNSLKFFTFYLLGFILLALVVVVLTLPKFLILDRLFISKGIYMMARSVQENITSLSLRDVKFLKDGSKISFNQLDVSLGFLYLSAKGYCADGYLELRFDLFGSVKLKGKDFKCLESFHIKDIDLQIDDGIKGFAKLSSVKTKDVKVDELSLVFKGRTFEGQALAFGQMLKGSGMIVLNRKDLLKSQINGTVSGVGASFFIYGNLENPMLELKK